MTPFDFQSFYFIRHGETDWNKDFICQGHNDIPLNSKGIEQARNRSQSSFLQFTEIFSSPLKRARQTAEIFVEQNPHIQRIIEVPDLMECKSEESARYVMGLKGLTSFPSFEHVQGELETPEEFFFRVEKGLRKVLTEAKDSSPLIVAHGGVCAAICKLFGINYFRTPNCCIVNFVKISNGYSAKVIED